MVLVGCARIMLVIAQIMQLDKPAAHVQSNFCEHGGATGGRCCGRSFVGEILHCVYCMSEQSLHLERKSYVLRYHFTAQSKRRFGPYYLLMPISHH